ncbi:MAG TPA: CsgG/HfaB family protein [Candidatus Paceibacterota bacterium]|nr:CsgG/HfaB family protein [Candidatus Paceibacterota bacterium]
MNRLALSFAAATALLLGGCAGSMGPFKENIAMARGPEPQVVSRKPSSNAMACVGQGLAEYHKSGIPVGIIAIPDRTGKANIAGVDATGAFNTQGGTDMAMSSLWRLRLKNIVEMGPEYRNVIDWTTLKASQGLIGDGVKRPATEMVKDPTTGEIKEITRDIPNIPLRKGTQFPMRYAIYGAIDALDFIPGGGVSGGAYGVSAGYNQNRAGIQIDLRLVEMPMGDSIGGRVIAGSTVKKQVVNDGTQVSLARIFGSASPVLVNFEAGAQRREPMQASTGDMLDLAISDLFNQAFLKNACTRYFSQST